ncbi:MAG: nuclear transport factor 2 family protein [Chitinophagaceae bacterium]
MDNEQNSEEKPDNFSDDSMENLRIENEILRIKIKTELGGDYESDENLPPELENEFLKNILAFEHRYAKIKIVKISDLLGNPVMTKAAKIDNDAIVNAYNDLEELLASRNIVVEFTRPRDERFKYRFITEELFAHETDDMEVAGMTKYFNYEEFHPDHEAEITEYSIKFLADWFVRKTDAAKWYMDDQFIQPDGKVFTREEMIASFKKVFAAYVSFEECGYAMDEVQFDLHTNASDKNDGMGFAEGMVKYTAVLENGEKIPVEGPFKFYFSRNNNRWRIFYFYLTGFNA